MDDKTAMNDVRRHIARARAAIEVNKLFARDWDAKTRAAELTAQLEREIADMEAELAHLKVRR